MADTINNDIPYVPENVIDPAAGLNISLNVIDALLQIVVESIGDTTPPAGLEGQRHIVGVGATGDWSGEDNKMARWLNGRWEFYAVNFVVYSGGIYTFNGSSWDPASGTVTSVAMTVPIGLEVTGSPITSSGTFAVTLSAGYSLVAGADRTLWDAAIQPTGSTIQDVTLDEYDETINATAGATLDRSTGGIQKLAMAAAVNLDVSALGAGQSVTYRITGADTHALTFTGLTDWSTGAAPTWKAIHYIEIVNFDGEIVAFDAGGR